MINRRDFIKNSILITGGLAVSQVLPGCNNSTGSGKKIFSFVQINDTHLSLPDDKGYPMSVQKLRSVISSINFEQKFSTPDFVLFVGDIIEGTDLNHLQSECEFSKKMFDELKCPYYTVIGNHEVMHTEGNPRFLNAYIRTFGEDRVNYSFIHKGFQFIVFDDSNCLGSNDDSSSLRNEWLINTFQNYENYPKFIVCHVPLVALREDEKLGKSFGYWSYKLRGNDTLKIIQNHSDKVIAVLNGHVHLTGMVKTNPYWLSFLFPGENDIYNISPSGLESYPCHYAHYTVYENKIDVRMIQVKHEFVNSSVNFHGKITDSRHNSPESYVCGNKDEQSFSIPLPDKKRPVAEDKR